ncbi:uncharacterized protein ColSpa_11435 [Colletotrichum spaethianum]|uniref:Uncharacterized protein n=1 Tax=Colletotrichum spaethianum TaxID=700344 RepID=A0AA37UKG4_9PEZI|nr:uncharacterized protein ColSpa_11435 [Colletotrichum spaethianum]GKT51254.1 hypothetical protein ColSpa_11435 [Colletotrichum spaethianum]
MCFTQKTVFTICAHYIIELVECTKFQNNPDKTGRHACIVPLCQHSQALATAFGFCNACRAAYVGLNVSYLNATNILLNFWSFKAAQKWNYAVDPSRVPVMALMSPTKVLCKSWFGCVQTYKEVGLGMVMALSVQSLMNALGEPVTTKSCDLCRANHCKDINRIAIGMREATIGWARGLKLPEQIFKSYEAYHGSTSPSVEKELNLTACKNQSHETRASSQVSQQQRAPQPPSASPMSSEDFPMRIPVRKATRLAKRLNAKVRMEIVIQEREEMFKILEAEHKRRVSELQAQVDLDEAGVSAGPSRTSVHDTRVGPSNPPNFVYHNLTRHNALKTPSPHASPRSSPSGGTSEVFSGTWEREPFGHVPANTGFELFESPRRDNGLRHQESSYADLVGGSDEFLFERRRARRSQYGETVNHEEFLSDKRFSFGPSPPSHFVGGVRRVWRIEDEFSGGDHPEYPRNECRKKKEYPNKQYPKDEYSRSNSYGRVHDTCFYEDPYYNEDDGNANEQGQSIQEDTIDEHINFYLDDDSLSISERVRPLTYISPQGSHHSSRPLSPQTPSPPSLRNADALPDIPPVSPLHLTEFSFLADLAERSVKSSNPASRECDASNAEFSMQAADPGLDGALGEATVGSTSRVSSGVAPLLGPEIRAVAPPRPSRGPMICITHCVERQNDCQRCKAGALHEVSLKPGERMNLPEPEQF